MTAPKNPDPVAPEVDPELAARFQEVVNATMAAPLDWPTHTRVQTSLRFLAERLGIPVQ